MFLSRCKYDMAMIWIKVLVISLMRRVWEFQRNKNMFKLDITAIAAFPVGQVVS